MSIKYMNLRLSDKLRPIMYYIVQSVLYIVFEFSRRRDSKNKKFYSKIVVQKKVYKVKNILYCIFICMFQD